MFRNKIVWLLIIMILCAVLPSCKTIMKRKYRKLKRKYDVEVIVFVQPGCAPCIEAKYQLHKAGIDAIYIDINTHARLARTWDVVSVPAFFIDSSAGRTRVYSINEILQHKFKLKLPFLP